MATSPWTPLTMRTSSDDPSRRYMKSVSETDPCGVVNTVSRIERVVEVSPRDLNIVVRRRDQPSSVLRPAEERGKTRGAVETGQAQPIDRAVAPDQRRRLTIADDGVVLNSKRHKVLGYTPTR